jgi:anti-sigma factor RsiW
MNHPNDEQWMSYLYDESDAAERASLKAHLKTCDACKTKVGEWQATQKNLAEWHVAAKPAARGPFWAGAPLLKLAAAALILCAGIAIGRLNSAAVSPEKVRAAIEPQLRLEFARMLHEELSKSVAATLQASGQQTKGMLADYAGAAETSRATDNAAILTALNKLSEQRLADYLLLKKDVDTVAVNTDLGFRSTQRELNQLADYPLPSNVPNPQIK